MQLNCIQGGPKSKPLANYQKRRIKARQWDKISSYIKVSIKYYNIIRWY